MNDAPPTPSGVPLVGHTLSYARDAFGFVDRAVDEVGDLFVANVVGVGDIAVLAHPEYIEQVLVDDRGSFRKSDGFDVAFGQGLASVEGDQWTRQRDALGEFFYPGRIRSYVEEMATVTERRLDRLEAGSSLSLLGEMKAMTLDNLFVTLFGQELDPDGDERLRQAIADLNCYFRPTSWVLPRAIPTPSRRRFHRAVEVVESEARRLLDERERELDASDDAPDDMLSTLVRQRREGTDLSDAEIRDQVGTMLFAGHDTTALTLTYALHALGAHPDVRERFHAELDSVLAGETPTLSDLGELDVTDRVVTEAMRLYPPVHTIPRETTEPVAVGDYRLPADQLVHLSLYRVHRDSRFYDDPRSYRPSRWRDQSPQSKGYAFAPFGGGPRVCIGQHFARLEAKLVLAMVGQRYRLDPEEPISFAPELTTQPDGDVPVRVERR